MTGTRIDDYAWAGGRETILRFGPATGPVVVAALPLFEEANRTRTFVVTILLALAMRGIAGALPDLPGSGESLVPTQDASIIHMREAFDAAVEHCGGQGRIYALAIRSGALLDTLAMVAGRWHLSPTNGLAVVRELAKISSSSETDDPVDIAGNVVSRDFLAELSGVVPLTVDDGVAVRTVRLESDPAPADRIFAGAPLWRRSEPDNNLVLAEQVADDIMEWIASCEGR